jgi:ferredoxin-like protein FixX
MSPGRGSTPRRTDWLTVSCKVTLTLTLYRHSRYRSLPSSQEDLGRSTPQRSPTQKQRICYYSDRRPAHLYRPTTLLSPHRPVTQPLPAEASQRPPPPQRSNSTQLARRSSSHRLTGNTPAAARRASLQRPEFSDILEVHKRPFLRPANLNREDNRQTVVISVSGCLECSDIPQLQWRKEEIQFYWIPEHGWV